MSPDDLCKWGPGGAEAEAWGCWTMKRPLGLAVGLQAPGGHLLWHQEK